MKWMDGDRRDLVIFSFHVMWHGIQVAWVGIEASIVALSIMCQCSGGHLLSVTSCHHM